MTIECTAKYDSGFEASQKALFSELLDEKLRVEEWIHDYDETNAHDKESYIKYRDTVDAMMTAMIQMYELEVKVS